tara:strand:+ start:170 stop:934 length:765 start_codon:yes stop_codon:yes gene_type:complete
MFYNFSNAIVRYPSKSVVNGLSKNGLKPDFYALRNEHRIYVEKLAKLGLKMHELNPLEAFPDSVFIEDPALTFKDGAILLRPGALSRQGEQDDLRPTLHKMFQRVLELQRGTVDGGDVLRLQNEFLIGLSSRTTNLGAGELQALLLRFGLKSRIVNTPTGVLHLKSDCSVLDEDTVFVTPQIKASKVFSDYRIIVTPEDELAAANLLRINDKIILPDRCPRTAELLSNHYSVEIVKVSEVSKLDAGLSCMSLRW